MFKKRRSQHQTIKRSICHLQVNAETIRMLTSQSLHLVIGGICDTASIHTRKPPDEGGCE